MDKDVFFRKIKDYVIENSITNSVCPSVIAALAAYISSYGNSRVAVITNNLFNLSKTDDYYGRYYSTKSGIIYNPEDKNTEIGSIYYRVYNTSEESIIDFISYLVTCKKSENGVLRYGSIIDCYDYKESINRLVRHGFMKYYMNKEDNVSEIQSIINIIEVNNLFEWDIIFKENVMSKNKRRFTATVNTNTTENDSIENDIEEVEEEEVNNSYNNISHMYRVRLSWDNPDTNIFSSPNYEDAKEEALKHEGYKIFIDDDGELFEDPWAKSIEEEISKEDSNIKSLRFPYTGAKILLIDVPVYRKANSITPYTYAKGEFYYYDETVVNRRLKITTNKNIKNEKHKNPSMIYGYIDMYI